MSRFDLATLDRYALGPNASAAQRQMMDEEAERRLASTRPADAGLPALLSDTLVAVFGVERVEANDTVAYLISEIEIFPGTERAAQAEADIAGILSL